MGLFASFLFLFVIDIVGVLFCIVLFLFVIDIVILTYNFPFAVSFGHWEIFWLNLGTCLL